MSRPFITHSITDDSALGGSVIERSLRFEHSANSVLSRSFSSTGNQRTFTMSAWIKKCHPTNRMSFFSQASALGSNEDGFEFDGVEMRFYSYVGGSFRYQLMSHADFRDTNGWYHVVAYLDTTQAVASNRAKFYINGTQITDLREATYPPQNSNSGFFNNSSNGHRIGSMTGNAHRFNGYLADVYFLDGYAYDPSYFGYTESQTGIWRPKRYTGAYGSNGYHLELKDNSSTSTLGTDTSGNGNNFSASNFSVAAGAGNDSLEDTPTNNFATFNPLIRSSNTFAEGNLQVTMTSSTPAAFYSTMGVSSGKYYMEFLIKSVNNYPLGISGSTQDSNYFSLGDQIGFWIDGSVTRVFRNGSNITGNSEVVGNFETGVEGSSTGWAVDDIAGLALDMDNKIIYLYKGSTQVGYVNFSTFDYDTVFFGGGNYINGNVYIGNFGQRPFSYTPPSGYKTLNSKNLPPNVPSIIRPQKHFETILYTGNGSTTQNITGLQFDPDFVWIKSRSASGTHHQVFDVIRSVGGDKALATSRTAGEYSFSAFDLLNNGFNAPYSSSAPYSCNTNGVTYVAWCWKAGGTAVTNNDGSITSQVSVNEEAGFSIISYTGNNTNNATVGHGLGKTPALLITKSRDNAIDPAWHTSHVSLPTNYDIALDAPDAAWNPSSNGWHELTNSSVFTLKKGSSDGYNTNRNGDRYIAYCWAEVPGYSKIGKYTGNGNSDGVFIHLGFRARWFLWKISSNSGGWGLIDTARDLHNVSGKQLGPDDTDPEASYTVLDITSTGIKMRNTFGDTNVDNGTFIYMAFAEQPGLTPYDTQTNAR